MYVPYKVFRFDGEQVDEGVIIDEADAQNINIPVGGSIAIQWPRSDIWLSIVGSELVNLFLKPHPVTHGESMEQALRS